MQGDGGMLNNVQVTHWITKGCERLGESDSTPKGLLKTDRMVADKQPSAWSEQRMFLMRIGPVG